MKHKLLSLLFISLLCSSSNGASSNGSSNSAQSEFNVFEASIQEIQTALEQGRVSSVDLVQQYLQRIDAYDKSGPALNAIIRINSQAMKQARMLDEERSQIGPRGLLHGIPIILKDNYNTVDMPTTGGSVALAGFIPSSNASQVDKLLRAGAIVLAKSNLHEYAYGITSISSILGQTRNPYDTRRVPGGSSGGTGAAIAASFAAVGMGSDTCGSIRIPSAFNNLIGLRPSKGVSSIYGVMPLSHTQDVAGPLARSVEDLAIVLDAVAGYDARDEATEIMQNISPLNFLENLDSSELEGLRLGKLESYFDRASAPSRRVIEEALDWYEQQGVEIVEVEIPELGSLIAASALIGHEFQIDLNQYLALFLSEEVLNLNDIVDLGLYHEAVAGALGRSRSSVFNEDAYRTAVAARGDLRLAIEQVFADQDLDAIVYPPIAETPVFTGENQPGNNCSISANSGLPALSLPAGFTDNGLPVGMELLGKFLQDPQLLSIAAPYELAASTRKAPSSTPSLIDGLPPEADNFQANFQQGGVSVRGQFSFDVLSNLFEYEIEATAQNTAEIYALTLLIDDESFELTDPIVLNLMGPDSQNGSGSYFMSPQFRQAFSEGRIYLKVFAETFPASGISQILR